MSDAETAVVTPIPQDAPQTLTGQRKPATPPSCAMVLFGARGDLTHRLVFPALYNLSHAGLLPKDFWFIGADIAEGTTEEWVASLVGALRDFTAKGAFQAAGIDEAALGWLTDRMTYLQGDLSKPEHYTDIGGLLGDAEANHGTLGNAIFYLAVADRFFGTVVENLGKSGLSAQGEGQGWRRVIIEKPFGHDLPSAHDLNARVRAVLGEDQTFRMDHFLGKETVQNIMALRFANGIFEPLWNRDRIDHVQITVAETVGVERRGKFYEATGAMRDMVPNHVFQLLALVAMEPPADFRADSIRNRKTDVLATARCAPGDAVRGQYTAGQVGGRAVPDYREEADVAPDSGVETYVSMKVDIPNWRWSGVPFYLRTGKCMPRRYTEIAIRFKPAPHALFEDTGADLGANWLVIRIQPDEGISLQFDVKRPGPLVELAPVRMDFNYKDYFPSEPNVGYETLLYDAMLGDATLFQRADQVEAGWSVVQPVLDGWAARTANGPLSLSPFGAGKLAAYRAGSQGPEQADDLIGRDGGRHWRPL